MRKELGKWLMDIAKYITTAVLLASVFNGIESGWVIYLCASTAIALTRSGGLWLLRDKKKNDN